MLPQTGTKVRARVVLLKEKVDEKLVCEMLPAARTGADRFRNETPELMQPLMGQWWPQGGLGVEATGLHGVRYGGRKNSVAKVATTPGLESRAHEACMKLEA